MMLEEPHIELDALKVITAPTLVLASDYDLILDEHTLEFHHHIPNSELCIFPNSTHMVPYDDPDLFNITVDRFFRTPFVRRDRVKDAMKSYEALQASVQ
jgi:pimeloyl-ACP methyl ester carboxylesterase